VLALSERLWGGPLRHRRNQVFIQLMTKGQRVRVCLAADTPPEAVRVCLGGPAARGQVRDALEFMAHALAEKPSMASSFL
jgi:hypothetical protein